jgi:methyltransferase-like protein/ubiquinone/menaquinone biosynthesis C-methylase UbiE
VLELGCASGGNLIPMAFNLPGSEFVGIDLSRQQIDEGLAAVQALNLTNIRIEHASILEIDSRWGQFDYVICHGVFSWVERPVQDKILEICRENLTPTGVAYISYNTYPGWHMRESVRHMMRYHAAQFDDVAEQVEQARALLTFLYSVSDTSSAYGQLLTREVEQLSKASDSYIFHEHLEQTNQPFYFHDFADRAERAGLQYLSEAVIGEMLTSHFPAEIAETLERISPDILHLEQYMDFVRNRQFRRTLLCHKSVKPKRALTPAFLHGLMVSSPATTDAPRDDLSASSSMVFTNGTQQASVSLPASKAAMLTMMETWPRAIDVDELCASALERAGTFIDSADNARNGLMGDLFGGVMHGIVQLHTLQPPCTNRVSERPRAHPLTAIQAHASTLVVNAHHEIVQLDMLGRELVLLANGTRGRAELLNALVARVESGTLQLHQRDERVSDLDVARVLLESELPAVLASLMRSGVLST